MRSLRPMSAQPTRPWHDVWDQLGVAIERVRELHGHRVGSTAAAWLDMGSFFQLCQGLRDYLKDEEPSGVTKADVDAFVQASTELCVAMDVANRHKHRSLTRSWTGDCAAGIVGQSVAVRPPTLHVTFRFGDEAGATPTPQPPATAAHSFVVEANGVRYDGLDLAEKCYVMWRTFLTGRGLLTT